jgi:RNA polymerase sigma factor (TIGR02999 family)
LSIPSPTIALQCSIAFSTYGAEPRAASWVAIAPAAHRRHAFHLNRRKFGTMAGEDWGLLVHQADLGEVAAKERLFAALYAELHGLAERQLRARAGAAISPTTLLHETYLSLAQGQAAFPDRERFLGYAARAMRSLIVDFARARGAQRRGGQFHITQLDTSADEHLDPVDSDDPALQNLASALDELAVHDQRLAEVVDLKYFDRD